MARIAQDCAQRAHQTRPPHWLPLMLNHERCGWVEPPSAESLARPPSPFSLGLGHDTIVCADGVTPLPEAMRFAAERLHADGIVRTWRSEQVDVRAPDGRIVATVDRAACRSLGVPTRSIHLNAFHPDGRMWVARRAAHKLNDPSQWDNLVGGMISAGETDLQALQRESWEEAGLRLDGLRLQRCSEIPVQRVVPDGLMIETIQVFDVQLPPDFEPRNLDGEVARFDAWPLDAVVQAIERREVTLEASLTMIDALSRIVT